ncbi:Conserved_hypothetical protein [Hexamita inflata]|uniref:Uncharacterized protein n=1 Tax=Hexamita inflata TaxID=28002 RepID=A0AA86U148_9EUKA|nr:Conserved hypothetical protein [Hexamita inflata]
MNDRPAYSSDDIDERVSQMMRNILDPSSNNTAVQQVKEFQNQTSATSNLRQRVQQLREKSEFYEQELAQQPSQLIDVRAQLKLTQERAAHDLAQQKLDFQAQFQSFFQKSKQQTDKLLSDSENLAKQNQSLAAQLLQLQTAQNDKIFAQNKQLSDELNSLKLNFTSKLQAEKQKLTTYYQNQLKLKIEEAVQLNEQQLSNKIEAQIQNIIHEKENEVLKLKLQNESALLTQASKYQTESEQKYSTLKNELLQDHAQELKQIQLQHKAELENSANEHLLKQKAKLQATENDWKQILQQEKNKHSIEITDLKQKILALKNEFEEQQNSLKHKHESNQQQMELYQNEFKTRFQQEITEIRQSYREFALNLFKQNKKELIATANAERDKYLLEIAAKTDRETQIQMQKCDELKEQFKTEKNTIIEQYELEINNYKKEIRELQTQLKSTQNKLKQSISNVKELENELKSHDSPEIAEKHRMEIEDAESKLIKLHNIHLNKEKQQILLFNNQLKDRETQINKMLKQMEIFVKENERLKRELKELEEM